MPNKVLVTGGAGYLGSILLEELLKKGYEVTLYDHFVYGVKPILHLISNPNLKIVKGDVRDASNLEKYKSKSDIIFHLAAVVGFPACLNNPDFAETTNLLGSKNISKNLSKDQKIIFTSTGSTYGRVQDICTEETPISPLTLYGRTKAEAENFFENEQSIILRYATVFGLSPRMRLDLLVNDFVNKAIHDKHLILYQSHFKRTFIHCRDAVGALTFSLENFDLMRGQKYNVGGDELNYTKLEIAELIKKEIPDLLIIDNGKGSDPDERNYEVSYKKISELGFKLHYSIKYGIDELKKIVPYIKKENEWGNA
jgi:nucleoside-diphosphate-sugar epimerase